MTCVVNHYDIQTISSYGPLYHTLTLPKCHYYQTYNYDPYYTYNNGVGYVQGYGNYGGGGVMLNSNVPVISY